jgi:hypothetical protein
MTNQSLALEHYRNGDSGAERISSVVERFMGGLGGGSQSCQSSVVGLLF